jgi:hypothetical protein
MNLLNLETLQPDVEGAFEQDKRTATLVPQLELTEAQLDVIHTGVQLYHAQLAHVQQERRLLQAHPPPLGATASRSPCRSSHHMAAAAAAAEAVPWTYADAGSGGGSDGSDVPPRTAHDTSSTGSGSSCSNDPKRRSSRHASIAAYQEHHAVAQAHLTRLSLLLQKEHMLRLAVVCL